MHDFVAGASEQATDLTVLAFLEFQFKKRAAASAFQCLDAVESEEAIRKVHSLLEFRESCGFRNSGDLHAVLSCHLVTRMSQLFGQSAVVGNQQQADGVFVETADGEQSLIRGRDQINSPRSSGGVSVRADNALRLVDQIVAVLRQLQLSHHPVRQAARRVRPISPDRLPLHHRQSRDLHG